MAALDTPQLNTGGTNIFDLILAQAEQNEEALAVLAPGRPPLTFSGLKKQIEDTIDALNSLGIGRNDRVALVVPNGPEAAVAFLAIASGATCAPLNPNYRASEFEFYLSDLNASAIIVEAGFESESLDVARQLNIPVIQLIPQSDRGAGVFKLAGEHQEREFTPGVAKPEDVALVLHTSGTTSRPKIVPLLHSNLAASAVNIRRSLRLGPSDRCLNVMPMFHIHGLIAAGLSSLGAGGSVVCTRGFNQGEFFQLLDEFRPTWYTAVPTMHQAVLSQAASNREIIDRVPLRFVRSASSALAPQVMAELESVFNAPAIEAYGMTEAGHQMASNPLPPAPRKPGSVGIASGPEVAILDEAGNVLPPDTTGEISVRGLNIMMGYEKNEQANASSFSNGWFRTGDQGHIDSEGYVFLTGRLKELINRGGEKISPREVDEVLLDHPAIKQVVTFAMPHPSLGEDIAAAVVLRPGNAVSEEEVRSFAAGRLAEFKVPRKIVILDEIPKGPTGKLQRIGLAEKLGLTASVQDQRTKPLVRPADPIEFNLAKIWEEILGVKEVGVTDDFFDLGGHSVLAVSLIERIAETFGEELSPATLLQAANIRQQAEVLRQHSKSKPFSSLVPIQPNGAQPPFYCVHEVGGYLYYRDLAHHLGNNQPFYGLQPRGLDAKQLLDTTIEEMAAHYISDIKQVQHSGPYFLGGFSFGGVVAYEMARQLIADGADVGLVVLIDAYGPGYTGRALRKVYSDDEEPKKSRRLEAGTQNVARHLHVVGSLSLPEKLSYVASRLKNIIVAKFRSGISRTRERLNRTRWRVAYSVNRAFGKPYKRGYRMIPEVSRRAIEKYAFPPYEGSVLLYKASQQPEYARLDSTLGWGSVVKGSIEIHEINGDHRSIVREPVVKQVAESLKEEIEAARLQFSDEQICGLNGHGRGSSRMKAVSR